MLIQSVPERSVYRVGIVTRAPPEPPDIVGGLFFWLGNSIPIVNSYLGGSVLFCMFGPALLNYFGLLPETTVKGVSILMKYGFQDVYIAALLCGSVLYMDRKILLGAISRYLPAMYTS